MLPRMSGPRRIVVGLALLAAVAALLVLWLARDAAPPPAPQPAPPAAEPAAPPPAAAPAAPSLRDARIRTARRDDQEQRFTERSYAPPHPLPWHESPPERASLTTPEATMAAALSAMARGDFDAWLELWDPDSRAYLRGHMERSGLTRDAFAGAWRRTYAGHRFDARRRLDLPDLEGYAIVYAGRIGMSTPVDDKQPLALRRLDDGTWALTHDLRDNPAFFYDSDARRAELVEGEP